MPGRPLSPGTVDTDPDLAVKCRNHGKAGWYGRELNGIGLTCGHPFIIEHMFGRPLGLVPMSAEHPITDKDRQRPLAADDHGCTPNQP